MFFLFCFSELKKIEESLKKDVLFEVSFERSSYSKIFEREEVQKGKLLRNKRLFLWSLFEPVKSDTWQENGCWNVLTHTQIPTLIKSKTQNLSWVEHLLSGSFLSIPKVQIKENETEVELKSPEFEPFDKILVNFDSNFTQIEKIQLMEKNKSPIKFKFEKKQVLKPNDFKFPKIDPKTKIHGGC